MAETIEIEEKISKVQIKNKPLKNTAKTQIDSVENRSECFISK